MVFGIYIVKLEDVFAVVDINQWFVLVVNPIFIYLCSLLLLLYYIQMVLCLNIRINQL